MFSKGSVASMGLGYQSTVLWTANPVYVEGFMGVSFGIATTGSGYVVIGDTENQESKERAVVKSSED